MFLFGFLGAVVNALVLLGVYNKLYYGEEKTVDQLYEELVVYLEEHDGKYPSITNNRHLALHVFYKKFYRDILTQEERSKLQRLPGWSWNN